MFYSSLLKETLKAQYMNNPWRNPNFSSYLFTDPKRHSIIRRKTIRYDDGARYIGFLAALLMTTFDI